MTTVSLPEQTCPHCHTPIGVRPFCSRDGTIVGDGRFVIGTRYVAEELLGGGGTSFVFAGRHLVLGKPVAIKVLREEASDSLAAKRFLREARNASQLGHENIISIVDFGHDEQHDIAYLVMELFAAQPLDRVIRSSAPIPPSRALPMLVQLVRALASSHAAGVIHRDVNPRNVLVGRGDLIKLCDFGLSRSVEGHDRVTSTGTLIGTPAYMAPEQIRGDDAIGSAADVFAFGCTAYEMLTGRIPHDAATPVAMLANRLNDRTVDGFDAAGVDISAELQQLVDACLAAEPADRPSAMDVEQRLLAISAVSGSGRRMAELDGMMIGRYRVVRRLGKGGVSSVYLGEHPVIGTKVAIKVIAPHIAGIPDLAARFVQEARASSELANPRIPRFFDFGILDTGQPYAVMEYLAGETLAARIAREHTLSVEVTAEILRQVASAMVQVHAAQLVHRDLKPDNLYLAETSDDRIDVKILDFGIAKALAPGASATQTSLGMILGTPYYCAPEQAMGLAIGPSTDVYALGATAYEMLSGLLPFPGDTAQVLAAKATNDAPRLENVNIPRHVADSIARMLARDPAARIATMADVLAELDRWTPANKPSTGPAPAPVGRQSWRAPIAGASVLLIALVVTVIAVFARLDHDGTAPAAAVQPIVTPLPAADQQPAALAPAPRPVLQPPDTATDRTAIEAPVVRLPLEGASSLPVAPIAPKPTTRPAAKSPRVNAARPPTKQSGHDDGVISDPFAE